MLYQLPNGKVIELSVEQYLELTDEDFEYLMCINAGEMIEDPFFGTAMQKKLNLQEIKKVAMKDMAEEFETASLEDLEDLSAELNVEDEEE